MQGNKEYQEKLLTSFPLSNHVPEDNFHRGIKAVLELDFLYQLTQAYYGHKKDQHLGHFQYQSRVLGTDGRHWPIT